MKILSSINIMAKEKRNEAVEKLHEMREKAKLGGGEKRIKAQHDKGKYLAR